MALTLADLKTTAVVMPERVLIYGPPGLGKTTLACEWPNPILLDIEGGLPPTYDIHNFPQEKLKTYDDVIDALGLLYQEAHDYKTVVIDTIDAFEPLVWEQACKINKWSSIEAPGYGKGYVEADKDWRMFLGGLDALRNERGMKVVLIAHSIVTQFDSPTTVNYSRFDIRVHKRATALLQDKVDAILFLNQEPTIKTETGAFGKKSHHAEGGGTRWIYTEGRPAFVAKNRYSMPERLMFRPGDGYTTLQPYFGLQAPPVELTDDPEPIQSEGVEIEKTF
jgi:DNA polymerase III delta prime subunit